MKDYYAIDSGVLIELCLNSPSGYKIRNALKNGDIAAYTHELALTELIYILCRKIGWNEAKNTVDSLLLSGFLNVLETTKLMEAASKIKCERPIALSDCFTLALAQEKKLKALFANKENELIKEIERKPFEIEIEFLNEP